jgi:predicted GIY-YIG superfamily endonuclease
MNSEITRDRTALYRFFDANDQLLYIGITNDIPARFGAHSRDKALTWWPAAVRHTIEWLPTRDEAAIAEVDAIKAENPLYNLSHVRAGKLRSASGGKWISPEDMEAYEWITISEVARRVVAAGIEKRFSRQRVTQLAESDPNFPLPRSEWRFIANMWLFPWELVEPYFRSRTKQKPGRRSKAELGLPTTRGHDLLALARSHFGEQPFTRTDLVGISPLSAAGVHHNVKALLTQGLLAEVGTRPNEATGRRAHSLLAIVRLPGQRAGS